MYYMYVACYGGIDWHDCNTTHKQLKHGDYYAMNQEDIAKVITAFIMEHYPYADETEVKKVLETKTKYTFPLKTEEKDENGKVVLVDCETFEDNGQIYYEDEATLDGEKLTLSESFYWGQMNYTTYFEVSEIKDENVIYVVMENFLAPTKGCPTVTRFYVKPFTKQEDAEKYFEEFVVHENKFGVGVSKELVIFDYEKIKEDEWFKTQLEIIELMEKTNQTYLDESFDLFAKVHETNLKKLL